MTCNVDIGIRRGNNYPPAQWQFLVSTDPDVLFDMTGSTWKLRVIWPSGGSIEVSTPELTVDLAQSILAWHYSVDQSRSLPLGKLTRYEIERWISGTQQTFARGMVVVQEGFNPDT